MEIVKKNLMSIICGVIAIAAVIIAFYPLDGKFDTLQTDINARKSQYDQIKSLIRQPRFLPIVKLNQDKADPLLSFPNSLMILTAANAQKEIRTQAERMREKATALNRETPPRGPLTPGSLPFPDQSAPFTFQQQLEHEYTRLRNDFLVGGQPPTPEEIQKAKDDITAAELTKLILLPDGKPANQDEITAETLKLCDALPDQLRRQVAHTKKIYLDNGVVVTNPLIKPGSEKPSPDRIWYAQVGFWVQQDICNAIAETNSASTSILESPVKRLAKVEIPLDASMYALEGMTAAQGGMRAMPAAPAIADPAAALPKSAAVSPTERVCNNLFDVVQFRIVVYVDASKIESFIKTLEAGRFITVRNINSMQQVDMSDPAINAAAPRFAGSGGGSNGQGESSGYIYGNVPVAVLDLSCEELMMRSWTEPLMPDSVKMVLGIISEGGPGQPGGVRGPMGR